MWARFRELPSEAQWSLVAGIAATIIVTSMNMAFGETLAATDKGKLITIVGSVVCAIAGVVIFGQMAGSLIGQKRYAAAVFPVIILVMATGWDALSLMGFSLTERLSAVAARQTEINAAADAQALRKKFAGDLAKTATGPSQVLTRSARREMVAAASAEIDKVAAGAGNKRPQLQADTLATTIAGWFSFTLSNVQLAIVSYFTVLAILIQSCGYTFYGYFKALYYAEGGGNRGDGPGGRRPKKQSPTSTATAPAAAPAVPANNVVPINAGAVAKAAFSKVALPPLQERQRHGKLRRREALEDLTYLFRETGSVPAQALLVTRWRVKTDVVSKWVSYWEDQGKVQRAREGVFNRLMPGAGMIGGALPASA